MPNKLQLKKHYAELVEHKTTLKDMPMIVTAPPQGDLIAAQKLEVAGTNQGIFIKTALPLEFQPEEVYLQDFYVPQHLPAYMDDPDLSDEEDLDSQIDHLFDNMSVLVNALDREIFNIDEKIDKDLSRDSLDDIEEDLETEEFYTHLIKKVQLQENMSANTLMRIAHSRQQERQEVKGKGQS